jgi:hypothetical protein
MFMSTVVLGALFALILIVSFVLIIIVKRKIRLTNNKSEQLKQLKEMKKQGFLTADEFKKIQAVVISA